ncbi:hypothetical protein GCM10009754_83850 [Amycolatopsis minnesotensis]|uniref:AbiEi antitoxin C-terminal domain-containing protein n=2 Tax=Amycolatopsis minnesotensis TaxID=337894 RepID=A0ABN2SU18_9PSEU
MMGVIKVSALIAIGMHSKTIYRRCLPGERWQRILPGVVLLRNAPPTTVQRTAAALLYAGPSAQLTGIEACLRHGLRSPSLPRLNYVHVLVPHERNVKSSEFVVVERTNRLPAPVIRGNFALAPIARATVDAARRIKNPDAVGKLLSEAVQQRRCAPEELFRELDEGSQRGTALPRRLLAGWTSLRSVAEARAKAIADTLPSPPSHWNVPVYDAKGEYVGCPDAWWDDVGLAWEIDSANFHFSLSGYSRTVERNTRYAAAGICCVQTLPSQITKEPDEVRASLIAAYETAAGRARPQVRLAAGS